MRDQPAIIVKQTTVFGSRRFQGQRRSREVKRVMDITREPVIIIIKQGIHCRTLSRRCKGVRRVSGRPRGAGSMSVSRKRISNRVNRVRGNPKRRRDTHTQSWYHMRRTRTQRGRSRKGREARRRREGRGRRSWRRKGGRQRGRGRREDDR